MAAAGPQGGAVGDPGFLRDLVRGMRCGVLAIDREGRLVMLNELACETLELERTPPLGVPVERAVPGQPELARVLRESFAMSSLPNRAEIDVSCPTGAVKTIGFTLSMVGEREGDPYGAAMFFKDLTQVERKEEQERLKDRLAALGQMAANMAHEIRNPLASIEVTCSLLDRRLGDRTEEKGLLDKIVSEVRRLNSTISSSLEFVRPLSLNLEPSEIEPVLEDALRVAAGRAGAPAIKTVKRFSPSIPAFVMDRNRLRQVFENLFLNAMEAMKDQGTLIVESRVVPAPDAGSVPYRPAGAPPGDTVQGFDSYVQVRVSDTGPGIREEHVDKLFYPFFTTKQNGSGVGLPMAKKIVDGHRGLLDVACRSEKGAEFTVSLPLIRPTED